MYCIKIYLILYIFNSFADFVPFPSEPILPNGTGTGVPFPYSAYRAGTCFRYPRSCFPRLVEFLFYSDAAAVEHIPQLHSCHSCLLGYLVKRVLSEHRDRRVALIFRKLLAHRLSHLQNILIFFSSQKSVLAEVGTDLEDLSVVAPSLQIPMRSVCRRLIINHDIRFKSEIA